MPASTTVDTDIDQLCINTIRTLSMDAVQAANSGHPGTPMALAPVAYTIYQEFLKFDPDDPIWPNRDRFVLSCGHASMLVYSLLHLTGVKALGDDYKVSGKLAVSLDDIKKFRQIDSSTPGHPEYHYTTGVETTTGPLGQGVATSVGMAIAAKWLGSNYNKPGFDLFDYDTYVLCSDGDMMEGISHEGASLAGHLALGNLCWIYDANKITIDGSTDITFTEDVAARFAAYGWNVHTVRDANDCEEMASALRAFQDCKDRPTFILVHSHIGYGSEKQDTSKAHGSPLGEPVIEAWKKKFNVSPEKFHVPDGVVEQFAKVGGKRGKDARTAWYAKFAEYKAKFPKEANELELMEKRELPDGWDKDLPEFPADPKGISSRKSSGKVINALAKTVPYLIGGSADLNESTFTDIEATSSFEPGNYGGRNLHFGIREHGMAAAVNGITLSKVRALGSTFFIFSDYARPAVRISAIMEIPSIFVFTHDSIGVGEDGPTHQPVEQMASLRAVPGLRLIRPADANEVVEAWKLIMNLKKEPVCLVLSRQDLPTFDRTKYAPASGLAKGAYIMADAEDGKPDVLLIGTGSEVQYCVAAYETLKAEGIKARVISMPSWDLFEHQPEEYQNEVIPPDVTARVTIEQAASFGWERYAGSSGAMIGMHTFGASAPLKDLLKKFGFTPDAVAQKAKEQIQKVKDRQGKDAVTKS